MHIDDKITWGKRCEIDELVAQFIHVLSHKDLEDYTLNFVYYDDDRKCWVIEYNSGGFETNPFEYKPYNIYRQFFTEERLREFLKYAQ